jgi:hypothetical protein
MRGFVDPKLQKLRARTNFDELFKPSEPELDLNQPVQSAPSPQEIEVARSTTDPLQINFATADIAEKLHNSRTRKGMKIFALLFIGGPTIFFGLALVVTAWSNPSMGAARAFFATVFGLVVAGFWPYVIFANRRKGSRSS